MPSSLIVLGSANLDYSLAVEALPRAGQTVLASSLTVSSGGKGSNQAIAAARAGAHPTFVAAVGDDAAGDRLLAALEHAGIVTTHVSRTSSAPTGSAFITVDTQGENTIVVAAGANATLDAQTISALVYSLCDPTSVLLVQLEIPIDVVVQSVRAAHAAGARIVLNASPFRDLPNDVIAVADPLIVNEGEYDAAAEASRSLVVTLGARGARLGSLELPAEDVPVVDTTGAGDSFAGTLAASLSLGSDLEQAVRDGIAAGARTVQHRGAQPPQ